jgi:hypothetical protein
MHPLGIPAVGVLLTHSFQLLRAARTNRIISDF